jgi:hypothetical protein
MIAASKRLVVFACPNCAQEVRSLLTKRELEEGLNNSQLHLYHTMCDYTWDERLGPQERMNIASFIKSEFPDSDSFRSDDFHGI